MGIDIEVTNENLPYGTWEEKVQYVFRAYMKLTLNTHFSIQWWWFSRR